MAPAIHHKLHGLTVYPHQAPYDNPYTDLKSVSQHVAITPGIDIAGCDPDFARAFAYTKVPKKPSLFWPLSSYGPYLVAKHRRSYKFSPSERPLEVLRYEVALVLGTKLYASLQHHFSSNPELIRGLHRAIELFPTSTLKFFLEHFAPEEKELENSAISMFLQCAQHLSDETVFDVLSEILYKTRYRRSIRNLGKIKGILFSLTIALQKKQSYPELRTEYTLYATDRTPQISYVADAFDPRSNTIFEIKVYSGKHRIKRKTRESYTQQLQNMIACAREIPGATIMYEVYGKLAEALVAIVRNVLEEHPDVAANFTLYHYDLKDRDKPTKEYKFTS